MSWRTLFSCSCSENWLSFARFLDIRESTRHLFGERSVRNSLWPSINTNSPICSRKSAVWICFALSLSLCNCRFLYFSADSLNRSEHQIQMHVWSMTNLWPQQQHWQRSHRRIQPTAIVVVERRQAIANRHTVVSPQQLHLEVQQAWRLKRVMAWIKRMQWLEQHPHSASLN